MVESSTVQNGRIVAAFSGTASETAGNRGSEQKNAPGGMEYSDYLRLLLMQKSGKAVTFGAMDLVEYNMRTEQQQLGFRLDCCVDELEAGFTAVIGKREYEITRNYGYEMQGAA